MIARFVIIGLLLATPAQADERSVANAISWSTVATQLTFDTIHSFKSENKKLAFEKQGIRLGIAIGSSELIKKLVHVERPDGSDNKSFWSEHSAISAASHGWNYSYGISLDIGTMSGRVIAKKHRVIDVLVGAGIGSLDSYLVNKLVK